MKWLTNIYDPNQPDAREKILCYQDETSAEAWQRRVEYLSTKVIGEPKETDYYSVAQLKAFHMVGVYTAEA